MTEQGLELKVGTSHKVMLYPSDKVVNARYLGHEENENVFTYTQDGKIKYLFFNEFSITKIGGIITYHPASGATVSHIEESNLRGFKVNNRLPRILENLGVAI